jgi:hypothetical protein
MRRRQCVARARRGWYAARLIRNGSVTIMKTFAAYRVTAALVATYLLAACTPTVQVAVPDKPITINLNIKIEHEIRVKVEKELEDLFTKESGLF